MSTEQNFWMRYVKLLVIVMVVGLAGYIGWQYRDHHKTSKINQASKEYETLLTLARQKDWKRVDNQAKFIVDRYPETSYAPLSALMRAKVALDKNTPDKAIEQLEFAIQKAKTGPVEHVARTRLARILISLEKYDEALKTLENAQKAEGFVSLYEELRGDVFVKQQDLSKARSAYQAALDAAPPGAAFNSLQLKLGDLPKEEVTAKAAEIEQEQQAQQQKDQPAVEPTIKSGVEPAVGSTAEPESKQKRNNVVKQ